jgi:hypothetical protein
MTLLLTFSGELSLAYPKRVYRNFYTKLADMGIQAKTRFEFSHYVLVFYIKYILDQLTESFLTKMYTYGDIFF